jgi:hypothetical protein
MYNAVALRCMKCELGPGTDHEIVAIVFEQENTSSVCFLRKEVLKRAS